MLVRDFVKNQLPSEWLVEGLVPAGHTVLVAGMPGAGKSYISEALAIAVASGTPYLGLSVTRGPVILVDEDTPSDELGERLIALSTGFQVKLDSLPLYVLSHEGFRLDGDLSRLEQKASKVKPKLIVLDCLSKMMGKFDENSARDCNTAAAAWNKLKSDKSTLFILHHLNKREGKIEADFAKLVRGSLALIANCDTAFGVELGRHSPTTIYNVYPIERRRRLTIREPFGIELMPQNGGIVPQQTKVYKKPSQLAKDIWPLFREGAQLSVNNVKSLLEGMARDYEIRDALEELRECGILKRGVTAHNRYLYMST
jgi:hypothetical protein